MATFRDEPIRSDQPLPNPPYGLKVMKGLKSVFLSREFADFSVHHEVSQHFRIWLSFTCIPDESYFNTLARIEHIEDLGNNYYNLTLNLYDNVGMVKGLCPRFSFWDYTEYDCKGHYSRNICHISFEDLVNFYHRNTLENGDQDCYVINKVNLEVDVKPIHYLAQHLSTFKAESNLKMYPKIN